MESRTKIMKLKKLPYTPKSVLQAAGTALNHGSLQGMSSNKSDMSGINGPSNVQIINALIKTIFKTDPKLKFDFLQELQNCQNGPYKTHQTIIEDLVEGLPDTDKILYKLSGEDIK